MRDLELVALRKEIHQYPEISGQESQTSLRIISFLRKHSNVEIIAHLGGHGVAAVYDFGESGQTVLIRCELDALPIQEAKSNDFEYRSVIAGVSHKCGHDGHMAMVAGVGKWLAKQSFKQGRVVLLFQPAEETGQGAEAVLKDPRFESITPDFAFALHNIPGAPLHEVMILDRSFSATVQSFVVYLKGKESHASEPENGVNPALAISELVQLFSKLSKPEVSDECFALLTPVHIDMGQPAYGISPANGSVHYTIRTWSVAVMTQLKSDIAEIIRKVSAVNQLTVRTEWFEYFPSGENNKFCNELMEQTAKSLKLEVTKRPTPFKFGEDFGWFAKSYKSSMFGLGAGESCPALHHDTYDFPDELIGTGVEVFTKVIEEILGD